LVGCEVAGLGPRWVEEEAPGLVSGRLAPSDELLASCKSCGRLRRRLAAPAFGALLENSFHAMAGVCRKCETCVPFRCA